MYENFILDAGGIFYAGDTRFLYAEYRMRLQSRETRAPVCLEEALPVLVG